MELKNQNLLYSQKFSEVTKTIQQSEEIFSKMKDEIQKVLLLNKLREMLKLVKWKKKM